MFFGGPLSGTRIGGTRHIFQSSAKGRPPTWRGSSQANGFFAAYLKFAGFDGIIVQGKAKRLSYIYIHDNKAELRSAEHLAGKDTWETEDALKEGLERKSSVYAIGPGGENMVRFACVAGDKGHVAAHNGLGAVMGSKLLKAIVAESSDQRPVVADANRLAELSKSIAALTEKMMPTLHQNGTVEGYNILHRFGQLPVRNYTTSIFPEAERFLPEKLRTEFKTTPTTCWGCKFAHCRMTEITTGPYKGFVGEEPEYEGLAAMSSVIGQTDPAATIVLSNMTDRLGIDVNESGYMIGWIMECYEKGYLKKDDLDGLEMEWGNVEATMAMLKKIANREGCGDMFAEGVKRAAEKVGGQATECAIYTMKGGTPRGHDHRGRWAELMDTCCTNTSTIEAGPGVPIIKELGHTPPTDPFDYMEVSTKNAMVNGRRLVEDSMAVCVLANQDFGMEVEAVNAATGFDYSIEEALKVGKRAVNTLRMFNFRHGLTADIERPSKRYGSVPVDGPHAGKDIMANWDAMRSNYYSCMGWDPKSGKPLPETLESLGLSHMLTELDKL